VVLRNNHSSTTLFRRQNLCFSSMSKIVAVALLAFVAVAQAANYVSLSTYTSSATCAAPATVTVLYQVGICDSGDKWACAVGGNITKSDYSDAACTAADPDVTITATGCTALGTTGFAYACQADATLPTGTYGSATFATTDCSGEATQIGVVAISCTAAGTSSTQYTCHAGVPYVATYGTTDCSGTATASVIVDTCVAGTGSSTKVVCSGGDALAAGSASTVSAAGAAVVLVAGALLL
jgi:hypothetical protein